MVIKVKGGGRVESTLSAILRYPLYKYVIYNNKYTIKLKKIQAFQNCSYFNFRPYIDGVII